MLDSLPEHILRRRKHLLVELAKVESNLGMPTAIFRNNCENGSSLTDLAPGKAIRRLLADRRTPLEPGSIVWALIAGNARVGSKHAEENILRAIRVNVELGLLVEKEGKIALPEWRFYERSWRREVKEPRIRFVMERMHALLGTGCSIEQLAREIGLSPSRLTHLFEREVSINPKEYMRRIRMRIVRNMLRSTRLKQKEILAIVGISDRSHFSREFKILFKSSPSRFRMTARSSIRANSLRMEPPQQDTP